MTPRIQEDIFGDPINPAHADMGEFSSLKTAEGYYRHGCTANCDQGRKACPCPDACQQQERRDESEGLGALAWPVACVVAICAVTLVYHLGSRIWGQA
jgi:hypothetical protein